MQSRPKLSSSDTLELADQLSKLFPESEWTDEQFDLFRNRVASYGKQAAREGLDDYRAACRYRSPVLVEMLKAIAARQTPFERSGLSLELERIRRVEEQYHREKGREIAVSRSRHIPHILDMGKETTLRIRDGLIERMGDGECVSQRNIAGCPTWDELIDPNEKRSRILCWRYWVIYDSFEAYEPEVQYA